MSIVSDTGWTYRDARTNRAQASRLLVIESTDDAEPLAIGKALSNEARPHGMGCESYVRRVGTVTRSLDPDGEPITQGVYSVELFAANLSDF